MTTAPQTCTSCRSHDLVAVRMTIGSGPVLFNHCRACEHRWWTDVTEAGRLSLNDVLVRAAA